MIHYADRTFCARPADECTCPPDRRLPMEVQQWAQRNSQMISYAYLCDGKKAEKGEKDG